MFTNIENSETIWTRRGIVIKVGELKTEMVPGILPAGKVIIQQWVRLEYVSRRKFEKKMQLWNFIKSGQFYYLKQNLVKNVFANFIKQEHLSHMGKRVWISNFFLFCCLENCQISLLRYIYINEYIENWSSQIEAHVTNIPQFFINFIFKVKCAIKNVTARFPLAWSCTAPVPWKLPYKEL